MIKDDSGPPLRLSSKFLEAMAYATELHADQARKGTTTPYLAHLLGVASLVLEDGGDEQQAIAALLHDAAEDHGGRPILMRIERKFGAPVAAIVEALSDSLVEDPVAKDDWRLRKERHLAHLREVEDVATLRVGLSDKLYNARAILRDHRLHQDALWERFSAGPNEQLWYYERLVDVYCASALRASPMTEELRAVVEDLRREVELRP